MEIPALWPVYASVAGGGQRSSLKPKPKPKQTPTRKPTPKPPPPAPAKLATAAPTTALLTPAQPAATPLGCLDGVVVVTAYGPGTRFMEKQALRADAERLGATVTAVLPSKPAASTTLVVALHPPAAPTPLMRRAAAAGVPVVGAAYLAACAAQQQRVSPAPFVLPVVAPRVAADPPPGGAATPATAPARKLRSLRDVAALDAAEPAAQAYEAHPAGYVVLRHIYLVHRDGQQACCVELDEAAGDAPARFRVLYQAGARRSDGAVDVAVHEVRLLTAAVDAEALYAELVDTHLATHSPWTRVLLPPARGLGSPGLHRLEAARRGADVPPAVRDLLTDIFEAADGALSAELEAFGLSSVTAEQLDQAESLLLTAARATLVPDGGAAPADWLEQLTDEFYAALPVQRHAREPLSDPAVLRRKQTLCRLLRDLLAVREGAGCAPFDATAAPGGDEGDLRYRALGCELAPLDPASDEYRAVVDAVGLAAPSPRPLAVDAIFVARRPAEAHAFLEGITPQRLLVHSTRAEHVVGILSRGLQLPQFAQVERTDLGNLGAGIYFADAAGVSAAYSRPSAAGHRYMVACTVALGKALETHEHQPRLRTCPEGYDSVHGVPGRGSQFADDEYVIFDARQQQLEYLIQFRYADEAAPSARPAGAPATAPLWLRSAVPFAPSPPLDMAPAVDLRDVLDVADPLSKVPSGLRCGAAAVPLVGVHVSARLVDLAAEVVVFQEYWNQNEWPLEAKYVFPLPPSAAVCGFEGGALWRA